MSITIRSTLQRLFHWMVGSSQETRGAAILEALLTPVSWIYAAIVKLRNVFYDKGYFKQFKISCPVVSIGNIEAGGTGKTPLVIALANTLSKESRVGIVLRGYCGKSKGAALVHGEKIAEYFGDEAALIAKNAKSAIVVVSKDRIKGAELAVKHGATLILLDDGMQHRKLYRNFEIAMVSSLFFKKNLKYLPAGVLRDDKKQLKRADIICGSTSFEDFSNTSLEMNSKVSGVFCISTEERVEILGKKVAIFCGIAHPKRFEATVQNLGVEIVHSHFLADHEGPTPSFFAQFIKKAKEKGADLILCTEKDQVKLHPRLFENTISCAYIKMEMEINTPSWQLFIDMLKEKAGL